METIATKRILRELKQMERTGRGGRTSTPDIKVKMINGHCNDLQAEIIGPPQSPYAQGKFLVKITMPNDYPFNPPKIRFITKVWHPNVSSVTGAIGLDILQDQWAAALTVRTLLISIQSMLTAAEPDIPQDAVVARQYKDFRAMFDLTARHWTNVYAAGPKVVREFNQKVQVLSEMGVDEDQARATLSKHNWDLEMATDELFS